ncbi:hypothetical protein BSLG_004512 [Batrachochytrium salamandrivorans]|nr:hypothetical protein BSLG_004512 [Batrachochytrium salamandrivorans]
MIVRIMSKQFSKQANVRAKQSASVILPSIAAHAGPSSKLPSKLTDSQHSTLRQFTSLNQSDWVRVTPNLTRGDVLGSILSSRSLATTVNTTTSTASEHQPILAETDVERQYREKYREKLERKAKEAGFDSVEQMLAKKRQDEAEEQERLRIVQMEKSRASSSSNEASSNSNKDQTRRSENLPSHAKTLDQIVKVDLLTNETPEAIALIWNKYHADKSCLSAVVDAQTYKTLYQRARTYPLFVVPLPRNDGYELYFMQFSGHQTYYTPLLEYKTHGASSRPSLIVTHYDDLAATKSMVLMVGELGDAQGGNLTLSEAQNLVYQTQLFYITGDHHQKKLVETFNTDSANFVYNDLIKAVETLG